MVNLVFLFLNRRGAQLKAKFTVTAITVSIFLPFKNKVKLGVDDSRGSGLLC